MSANDIVISGMGGRFPESRNVDEFCNKLFEGIDMVTNKDDRWPDGTYGLTNRLGRIYDIHHFDGSFFGLIEQMNEVIDPPGRLLVETAYEAIIDAGINPQSIRGTNTAVVVGSTYYPGSNNFLEEVQPDSEIQVTAISLRTMVNMNTMIANRISFVFDFKGLSISTDTACSSSGSAFVLAVNEMLLGRCDYAIVGGVQLNLTPALIQMQQKSGVCSSRGVSAVLDESADGFVKSDGVACLLLQRRATAKRVYATVLSARMNVDGYKKTGQFFPSSKVQEDLMVETYKESQIDPLSLTYLEGHLTGTRVGDPEEVKAIYNAYCALPGRTDTLPLGAVKSNIGHTEGCSGLASVIKVCLAFENERLPPNINLKTLKHEIKEFCPPLYPNTEVIPYKPGLAAVNNFGIGGVNVHILVEPNYKTETKENLKIAEKIPRIVNICGRTEEAVRHVMDFIENNPNKVTREFLALLTDTMKYKTNINSSGLPYKGIKIQERMKHP